MNFLISQNESSAQHVTIARYDMKNPIKIVNLLICMDFHSVKPTCWLSVINPQAPAAVATDDRTRITAKQLKKSVRLNLHQGGIFKLKDSQRQLTPLTVIFFWALQHVQKHSGPILHRAYFYHNLDNQKRYLT